MKILHTIIMRAQPFHKGHSNMIKQVQNFKDANDSILILIGSSNKKGTQDNPFSYEERKAMIQGSFPDVTIAPLKDYDYNYPLWEEELHNTIAIHSKGFDLVELVTSRKGGDDELRMSWARNLSVNVIETTLSEFYGELSATFVRNTLLESNDWIHTLRSVLSDKTLEVILTKIPLIEELRAEQLAILKYKADWAFAPFPNTLQATDAVVRDVTGRFLMIKRKSEFGEGQLALCGGFLEHDIDHETNMKKELEEECSLYLDKTPHEIVTSWFCGAVNRSKRGRMSTNVYLVQLEGKFEDLDLCGGDDAHEDLCYLSKDELDKECLFSDHEGLIERVLHLETLAVPYIKNY